MGGGRGRLPDTKRGGGQSTSGPIYEKWGGGGGAIRFRSITKSGGGGGPAKNLTSQAFAAIYFVDKKYVIRKIEMIA